MTIVDFPAKKRLSIFLLVMINLATILSIKNWPMMAEYGFSSIIFLLVASLTFFIPVSLVSAELASSEKNNEGIFGWVKEAFGEYFGFLAVWLLWVENVIWYPTMFSFIAATLCYSFNPELSHDLFYNVGLILILFWSVLIINLFGISFSSLLSTFSVIFGTILPGSIIIIFGYLWFTSGETSQINFSLKSLIPSSFQFNEIVFLVGMALSFSGIEMNAIHAKDVKNPQKSYPKAIFISTFLIIVLYLIGTLAIGMIIPKEKINLVTAPIEAISYYLAHYKLSWAVPIFSLMITIGALGGISAWLTGTSKTLLTAGKNGNLPSILRKVNRHDVPTSIMIFQGIIASLMTLVFFAMPNISSGFWILTVLATQLYLLMYMLMFASAIFLRYKKPYIEGTYKIPGGKKVLVAVSALGFAFCLFAFGIGFVPPAQLNTGNVLFYDLFLLCAVLLFCILPVIIRKFAKRKILSNVN